VGKKRGVEPRNFFGELKRRSVYKVAVAYAVVGWLLIQVATQVFPFFEIPNWGVRLVILLLMLGFPVALILAWAFELTPEGIKRAEEVTPAESRRPHRGRKLTALILIAAGIAAALLVFQFTGKLGVGREGARPAAVENVQGQRTAPAAPIQEKSVAVLPFENLS
jgi:hypothetical protein